MKQSWSNPAFDVTLRTVEDNLWLSVTQRQRKVRYESIWATLVFSFSHKLICQTRHSLRVNSGTLKCTGTDCHVVLAVKVRRRDELHYYMMIAISHIALCSS